MDILQEYLLFCDDASVLSFSNTCKYLKFSVAWVQGIENYWKRRLENLIGTHLSLRKLNDTWKNMYRNLCKNQLSSDDSQTHIINAGLNGYDEITDIMLDRIPNLSIIGINLVDQVFEVSALGYHEKTTRVAKDYVHLYPGCAVIRILQRLLNLGNLNNPDVTYISELLNIAAIADDLEFMKHLIATDNSFSIQLTQMPIPEPGYPDFLDFTIQHQSTEILKYILQFPGLHTGLFIGLGQLSSIAGNVAYVQMILGSSAIPRVSRDCIIQVLYTETAVQDNVDLCKILVAEILGQNLVSSSLNRLAQSIGKYNSVNVLDYLVQVPEIDYSELIIVGFQSAVPAGNLEFAKVLLDSMTPELQESQINRSIATRFTEAFVKFYIAYHIEISGTAFLEIIVLDNSGVLNQLLVAGISPNIKLNNLSLIEMAIETHSLKCVELLLTISKLRIRSNNMSIPIALKHNKVSLAKQLSKDSRFQTTLNNSEVIDAILQVSSKSMLGLLQRNKKP